MITHTVTRTVARGIFANRSKVLPPIRDKLLLTLRPYAYGEDVILDDIYGNLGEDVVVEWRGRYGEDVPIVGYMIPEDMQAEMFAILGNGLWFDSNGIAKQVNNIELAQSPEINQWAVWYRLDYAAGLGNREVFFYNPDTLTDEDAEKIAAWFKTTYTPQNYPSAFFNGLDFSLATYTGGPTYVPDHLGVLRSPGSNLPAVQGMRLATTVADGAVLGPELVVNGNFDINTNNWAEYTSTNDYVSNGQLYQVGNEQMDRGLYQTIFNEYRAVGRSFRVNASGNNGAGGNPSIDIVGAGLAKLQSISSYPYIYTHLNNSHLRILLVRPYSKLQTSIHDNVSLKELIPTYVTTDSSGNPIVASTPQKTVTYSEDWTSKTFAETFNRFDISDPLKAPGFLCEPVRTNYLLYSDDFLNAYWTKDHLTLSTSSDVYAPDGKPATLLTVNSSGYSSYLKSGEFSLAVGVFTASRYVKAGTARYCTIGLYGLPDAYFDLQEYTYSFIGTSALGAVIEPIGGGWVLISATWNVTVAKAYNAYFAFANSLTTQINVLGASLYSCEHQLELGAFKTSHIPTTTATITRAATIASFPTAGKIPVNDFAIRMIVVPRASGQSGAYLFGSYVDANNSFSVSITSTAIALRKRISGVNTDATVTLTHSSGVPIDIVLVSTAAGGMQISARTFSSTWGSFTNGTVNSSSAAKANAQIGSTYQLGALNSIEQFTGNISLFDCVPIPSGTTDPMAWAKAHWGAA